jgi:hypothetical protein
MLVWLFWILTLSAIFNLLLALGGFEYIDRWALTNVSALYNWAWYWIDRLDAWCQNDTLKRNIQYEKEYADYRAQQVIAEMHRMAALYDEMSPNA